MEAVGLQRLADGLDPAVHPVRGSDHSGPGMGVDSPAYAGYVVPPYYDSMIGKVIAYGATRDQAIKRMDIALSEMVVEGIHTNIALHRELMIDPCFIEGGTNIHYLEHMLAERAALLKQES